MISKPPPTHADEKETARVRIRVLVSACLLGARVRYDGGHKRNPVIVETLGRFFEYVSVCPEVGCGLPTPREAMKLAGDPAHPRLVTVVGGVDHTREMHEWIRGKLKELKELDPHGYICKGNSPSCAIDGMFTTAFRKRFPRIPVEDEDRLENPVVRETFVKRVFTVAARRTKKAGR